MRILLFIAGLVVMAFLCGGIIYLNGKEIAGRCMMKIRVLREWPDKWRKALSLLFIIPVLLLAGCGLLSNPDNTKKVTQVQDTAGNPATVTEYTSSDVGKYFDDIAEMVSGSTKNLNESINSVVKSADCSSLSGEAKAWCGAAVMMAADHMVSSHSIMVAQVVRDVKRPTSGYDVLNNVVDKNTIPLLGAMGVIGWISEAFSGAGSTINDIQTQGGSIGNSFNRSETHFTGNPTLDGGASIKIPFLSPETTTTTTIPGTQINN